MKALIKIAIFCSIFPLMGCKDKRQAEAEQPMRVSVARPEVDSVLLSRSYPATLHSATSAEVVARVNGTILRKLFSSGDFVRAGQPLYIIEATTYHDAVAEAQAALQTAQAQYDYDSRQYQAMQEALKADAVSRMNVIQAESNLRQSEAAIKTAKAKLHDAETQLSHCTVTAPISGKISKSAFDPGAYVSGADSPVTLANIFDDRQLHASFSIPTDLFLEIDAARKSGAIAYNRIPVSVNDSLVATVYGKLTYMAPDVDSSTGTVELHVALDNTNAALRDGMYATVALPYAMAPKAIVIRDASISTDQLGRYVYLVNDSNQVVYTPIEVGPLYRDTLRIVTKGLSPTDRYVTTALLKVRDGMPVVPVLK
jgi:RND family efflux transporter MFP subunit